VCEHLIVLAGMQDLIDSFRMRLAVLFKILGNSYGSGPETYEPFREISLK
jgi:hypothetical protein